PGTQMARVVAPYMSAFPQALTWDLPAKRSNPARQRSGANVLMVVCAIAMRMAAAGALGRDDVQFAVAHAALAHSVVRQRLNRLDRPAQHRDLKAGMMVEMDVQGRHLEIVVTMLRLGEPPPEVARLVVVDIGQGGDAEA